MVEVGRMSQEFQKFLEREIIPFIEEYKPKNNREQWYCKWKLIPAQKIDADTYIALLLKLREDPSVTWQFKTFLLQIINIIYFKYVEPQETKLS